mmetsp:Transcript_4275/g.9606  ORF Transcript_4275/g.9606 Transcript_4275/m.9606 type:complete len:221 (-) Transcript_4275:4-666(-)
MMRALGRERLLPFVPAPRRKAPMEAAMPKQTVPTSQGMYCMVSKIAMPLEIEPPGLLMYIVMSASGSSFARYSSCATTALAMVSSTPFPIIIILSFSRREFTSIFVPPKSTTGSRTGTSGAGSSGSLRVGSTSGGTSGSAMDSPRAVQVGCHSPFFEEKSPGLTAFNWVLLWCSLPTENADTTALLKMSARNSATALIIVEQGMNKKWKCLQNWLALLSE